MIDLQHFIRNQDALNLFDGRGKPRKRKVPVIPPLPSERQPSEPNPVCAICGECGLELRRVMSYSCPRTNCPCGLGSATSFSAKRHNLPPHWALGTVRKQ